MGIPLHMSETGKSNDIDAISQRQKGKKSEQEDQERHYWRLTKCYCAFRVALFSLSLSFSFFFFLCIFSPVSFLNFLFFVLQNISPEQLDGRNIISCLPFLASTVYAQCIFPFDLANCSTPSLPSPSVLSTHASLGQPKTDQTIFHHSQW